MRIKCSISKLGLALTIYSSGFDSKPRLNTLSSDNSVRKINGILYSLFNTWASSIPSILLAFPLRLISKRTKSGFLFLIEVIASSALFIYSLGSIKLFSYAL